MMRFSAMEIRPDGRKYVVHFNAESWGHAEVICDEEGYIELGELIAEFDAETPIEEVRALCDRMNNG